MKPSAPLAQMDADLVAAYQRQGLVGVHLTSVHLPTQCPRAASCWGSESVDRRPAVGSPASELSPPYIGARFSDGRMLILLENLFEHGGFDLGPEAKHGMRFLADEARRRLGKGAKVLFRGGGYKGTIVWHRAISYAAAWLRSASIITFEPQSDGTVPPSALTITLDFVAIAQHVKCSPLSERSEQTPAMWTECGRHVLVHELAILQPTRIIVVGRGDNAGAFRKQILPTLAARIRSTPIGLGKRWSEIEFERRESSHGPVDVLIVPHPATAGGAARAITSAVGRLTSAVPLLAPHSTHQHR